MKDKKWYEAAQDYADRAYASARAELLQEIEEWAQQMIKGIKSGNGYYEVLTDLLSFLHSKQVEQKDQEKKG